MHLHSEETTGWIAENKHNISFVLGILDMGPRKEKLLYSSKTFYHSCA